MSGIELKNRMAMAPMTRSRADENYSVTDITVNYYSQRASAGLIVTEGTAPSPNGLGYARTPGIYSQIQIDAWKKVTESVHKNGGKIFLQLMHVGRIAHSLNTPDGARILAPSAVAAQGQMWTDKEAMKELPIPEEMTKEDLEITLQEFVQASKNAIMAGFDGVELHGANGYLLSQFLADNANQRTDEYGGSVENKIRFPLEVTKAVIEAIGKEKVGYRISPGSKFNDILIDEPQEIFSELVKGLSELGIAYLHINRPFYGFSPAGKEFDIVSEFRRLFKGTILLCGGISKDEAINLLNEEKIDIAVFGQKFLANPDLPERFMNNWELNTPNQSTFYSPGETGYTDYPTYKELVGNKMVKEWETKALS